MIERIVSPCLLALVIPLAFEGCSSPSSAQSLPRPGPDAVLVSVPAVKQEELKGCGLACLISLLDWSGTALDDEARARFNPERLEKEEIAAGELRDYLRKRRFRVALVHGAVDGSYPKGIFTVLRKGVPPIVEIESWKGRHYVLVCGFDPTQRLVFLMDPEHGLAPVGTDDFEELWTRADHLMLVAIPPSREDLLRPSR